MSVLFPVYELAEAERKILRRVPLDRVEGTARMAEQLGRLFGESLSPQQAVRRILDDVRRRGDAALLDWTLRLDRTELKTLCVSRESMDLASSAIDRDVLDALRFAAKRIEEFHRRQPLASWIDPGKDGLLGQVVSPIERAGIYVPGGSAPLPSTLLMCAIPARIAGVREIYVCTPPSLEGTVPDIILAAAHTAGIDAVFSVGGAQAIAAMAWGTQSIPRVDKIVGPGNLFVTLAKQQVYGAVGIDGLLGPSETIIIADDGASPAMVAADLLAQAEHDALATAIVVTPFRDLAARIASEVERQIEALERAEVIRESMTDRGGAVIVRDLDQAMEVANVYAPEHLQLSIREPAEWLGRVRHAGAVFLGEYSCEVLGDYAAGPSHSLPTGGTARFASGLSVLDFVKTTSIIALNAMAASELGRVAAVLARAEGLTAHAAAAQARIRR